MSNFDPDIIYNKLVKAGNDWSDKDAAAFLLEENKKNVLANLMKDYLNKDCSVSKAETYARASKDYQDYIKKMSEARKEANKARVTYDSLKTLASLRQSMHVTKRAEMKFI